MIAKEVNYDLAVEEWQVLLNHGNLTPDQQKMARSHLAGLRAEKDMAYHLKAFFAGKPDFQVFNNLKIEHNGQTNQIDHLVLTRWSAYFIESKSVSQVITINEHGEWGRIYNRRFTPIASPLEQSRRHKEQLYSFMTEHRDQFMGKLLGIKLKNFHKLLTAKHYVAISTNGQIQGRGRKSIPEVMKVDQVPSAIIHYHDSLNRNILTGWDDEEDMPAFNEKEFRAAIEFLLKSDIAQTPTEYVHGVIDNLEQQAVKFSAGERDASDTDLVTAGPAAPVIRRHICRKCESESLKIVHGPYGYYFKCNACKANTPIVEICENCSTITKISKAGDTFT